MNQMNKMNPKNLSTILDSQFNYNTLPVTPFNTTEYIDMLLRFKIYLILARFGISAEGLKVQSLISFTVSSCL